MLSFVRSEIVKKWLKSAKWPLSALFYTAIKVLEPSDGILIHGNGGSLLCSAIKLVTGNVAI